MTSQPGRRAARSGAPRLLFPLLTLLLAPALAACSSSAQGPRAGGSGSAPASPRPGAVPGGTPGVAPAVDAAPAQGGGAAAPVVMVVDTAFEPPRLVVPAGTTVTWRQTGQQPHSVTASAGTGGAFDSSPACGPVSPEGCLHEGSTYSFTFTRPGTHSFYCRVHGTASGVGMTGTIVVEGPGAK